MSNFNVRLMSGNGLKTPNFGFKIEQFHTIKFSEFFAHSILILTSSSWEYLAAFFSASSRESPNPVGLFEAIFMVFGEVFVLRYSLNMIRGGTIVLLYNRESTHGLPLKHGGHQKDSPPSLFLSGTRYIATKCDFALISDGGDVMQMTSRWKVEI